MSRRRYISTDISTDPKVAELAEYGPLPLLLYTWAIPHMDDWGRIIGEPRQFKLLVCPALDVTASAVDEALTHIASVGLWERYEVEGRKYIAVGPESWFKHQTYINHKKREEDKSQYPCPFETAPNNAAKRRKTPQNTEECRKAEFCVPSPSPSPSLTKTKDSPHLAMGTTVSEPQIDIEPPKTKPTPYQREFDEFWSVYPRKVEKQAAYKRFCTRLRDRLPSGERVTAELLTRCAANYAVACSRDAVDPRYIKHASSFLGSTIAFADYIAGPGDTGVSSRPPDRDERRRYDYEQQEVRDLTFWLDDPPERGADKGG